MMEYLRAPEEMVWTGNLSENWRVFIQRFRHYISAIGYENKTDKMKTSTLLCLVGTRGMEIFNEFKFEEGHDSKLDSVITQFEGYCNPRKNQTFHRFLFFSHAKPVDMDFRKFVSTLRKLAEPCEFGALRDSLIRDRIISSIPENDLRKKLLVFDTLTLEKCIEMCTAHEAVAKQAKLMVENARQTVSNNNESPPPIAINPLISDEQLELAVEVIKQRRGLSQNNSNASSSQRWDRDTPAKRRQFNNGQQPQGKKFKCTDCETWHFPRRCPAYNKVCYSCGYYGHYGKYCGNERTNTNPRNSQRRNINTVDHQAEINSVSTNDFNNIPINPVQKSDDNWYINFKFHGYGKLEGQQVPVNCKIDTGAMANVIPVALFNSINQKIILSGT